MIEEWWNMMRYKMVYKAILYPAVIYLVVYILYYLSLGSKLKTELTRLSFLQEQQLQHTVVNIGVLLRISLVGITISTPIAADWRLLFALLPPLSLLSPLSLSTVLFYFSNFWLWQASFHSFHSSPHRHSLPSVWNVLPRLGSEDQAHASQHAGETAATSTARPPSATGVYTCG